VSESPFDIVAIDLDGTLLTSDKRLSPEDACALRAACSRGVRIVLATARPPRGVRWILDELGILANGFQDAVTINYNGALVWDGSTRSPIEHTPLEALTAREIVERARQHHAETMVSVETLDVWHTDRHDPGLSMETSKLFPPDYVGPLDGTLAQAVTKLMLIAQPEHISGLRERMSVFESSSRAGVFVTDPHIVQVAAHGVDKGAALARHADRLGIAQSRVLAIGDASNDVGMLRWAGLGVAMANAERAAADAADETLDRTNDDAGVAHALRRFGVIG
jgi:Cof subfamily protein (haloacid dehalogenase superfamily)